MVPSILFNFFVLLFAAVLVAAGIISWPVGIALGIGLIWLERKFFAASHATEGDEVSDEPHEHVHEASPPEKPAVHHP